MHIYQSKLNENYYGLFDDINLNPILIKSILLSAVNVGITDIIYHDKERIGEISNHLSVNKNRQVLNGTRSPSIIKSYFMHIYVYVYVLSS